MALGDAVEDNPVFSNLGQKISEVPLVVGSDEEARALREFVRAYTHHVDPREESAFSPDFLLQAVGLQWHTLLSGQAGDICVIEAVSDGVSCRTDCHEDGTVQLSCQSTATTTEGTAISIISHDMIYLVDTFLQALRGKSSHLTTIHPILSTASLRNSAFSQMPTFDTDYLSFFCAQLTGERSQEELKTIVGELTSRFGQLRSFNLHAKEMSLELLALTSKYFQGATDRSLLTSFIPMAEIHMDTQGTVLSQRGLEVDISHLGDNELSDTQYQVALLSQTSQILEDSLFRAVSFPQESEVVHFIGLFKPSRVGLPGLSSPEITDRLTRVCANLSLLTTSHSYRLLTDFISSLNTDTALALAEDDFENACKLGMLVEEVARVQVLAAPTPGAFARLLVVIPGERLETGVEDLIVGHILSQVPSIVTRTARTISKRRLVLEYATKDTLPPDLVIQLQRSLDEVSTPWKLRISNRIRDRLTGQELARALALLTDVEAHLDPTYKIDIADDVALEDIIALHKLVERGGRLTARLSITPTNGTRLHLITIGMRLSLSEILPVVENLGFSVIDELPYFSSVDGTQTWVIDLGLKPLVEGIDTVISQARVAERIEAFLSQVWTGETFNDSLNQLAIIADLTTDEIEVLRALAAYLRLGTLGYSEMLCRSALIAQPTIARSLAKLFFARFDPDLDPEQREATTAGWFDSIETALSSVSSLEHDKILRSMRSVIMATLRTNVFHEQREAVAFKFDPTAVPFLPLPLPHFEIYLHGRTVEAIHLRGGRIARGGIRYSDRLEDFRTEILGLMKAQSVKNAVIVPVGAKGGFIVKDLDPGVNNSARVERAYRLFMTTLLSLTDNLVNNEVIAPERTICYDSEDHYLVVAADKGTATFSDIANSISLAHGFWLGDAFASGGSHGFDHKEMGITAKGAWVSVLHHFDTLGIDIHSQDFTVVGIGDLSGDVFGNGMLRSRHTKLIAAFDHRHIFLDPHPNPEQSFLARQEIFSRGPGTSWNDYPTDALSEGGGVYSRTLKRIPISPEVAEVLDIDAKTLEPAELIRAILKAPVDLLFNGGIGTYVKATSESNLDAADKSNDAVRVNGNEVRARVVGEGGNLGLTQLGRIEYVTSGGRCNTDSIDNSAGVDTSDHEVNIKIALDALVRRGQLDEESRNDYLMQCTDEVEDQVLADNVYQNWVLSAAEMRYSTSWDDIARLLSHLMETAHLDPAVEFLPHPSDIRTNPPRRSLTRPEFSIVISYVKEQVNELLKESEFLDHDLALVLFRDYFPDVLADVIADTRETHPLRREITSTALANLLVNHLGIFGLQTIAGVGAIDNLAAAEYAALAIWITDAPRIVNTVINRTEIPYAMRMQAYLDMQNLLVAISLELRLSAHRPTDLLRSDLIATLRERFATITRTLATRDDIRWEAWRSRSQAMEEAGFSPDVAAVTSPGRTLASILSLQLTERYQDFESGIQGAIDLLRTENETGIGAAKIALAGISATDLTSLQASQAIEDSLNRFARRELLSRSEEPLERNPVVDEITRAIESADLLAALLTCLRLEDATQ